MTTAVHSLLEQIRRLTPDEQLEIIKGVAGLLHDQVGHSMLPPPAPPAIHHTAPVASLDDLAADFWPEDESADDINAYIAAQRAAERMSDL